MKKKIAVVIVTFNGEIWIKKNLNSLLNSNYPIDIIIVDNASTDETINIIKEFSAIELIQNKNNLGFGKANTIGIDLAIKKGADAIFLLNQDTWIYENTITNLAETLFSKMARTFLKLIRVKSWEELRTRILKGVEEINKNPVVHQWNKFDALSMI